MFNLTKKAKNYIIGILVTLFVVSIGALIPLQTKNANASVEKQYIEAGVKVNSHPNTAEYPNSIVLETTVPYTKDGTTTLGAGEVLGTMPIKIDGVEKTVTLHEWYAQTTLFGFEYDDYASIKAGCVVEIAPGTVVEVAEGVQNTYKFTEGCFYVYNGSTVVWEAGTYVDGAVSSVWYDGSNLQMNLTTELVDDNGNAYGYEMAYGKLDVKINGISTSVAIKYLGTTFFKFAMEAPVDGVTTFEIEEGTFIKNPEWITKIYRFTEGCKFVCQNATTWIDPNAPQVYKVNVSANDGSSFSVEVNPGEDYYLPEKVNEKVVLGYVIDGVNYMAGTSITVNDNVNVVAKVVKFNMEDGAAIRVNSAKGGIKFTANINYDELASTGYIIEKVGFMIIPTDYLLNKEFEYENFTANHKDGFVDVELSTYSVKSIITATMIDLDESLYNKKFSARAYVKYTVDGESKYIYTDYDQDKNSRSCYEVALMALADPEMDGHHAELKVYCDNIIDLTEVGGQVSITQNEYSQYSTLVLDSATAVNGVLTVKISGINVNAGTGILYNGYRITEVSNVEKGEGYVQFSIEVPIPI